MPSRVSKVTVPGDNTEYVLQDPDLNDRFGEYITFQSFSAATSSSPVNLRFGSGTLHALLLVWGSSTNRMGMWMLNEHSSGVMIKEVCSASNITVSQGTGSVRDIKISNSTTYGATVQVYNFGSAKASEI